MNWCEGDIHMLISGSSFICVLWYIYLLKILKIKDLFHFSSKYFQMPCASVRPWSQQKQTCSFMCNFARG